MSVQRKRRVTRRSRDYLLPREVDRLLKASLDDGRFAHRNYTLILLCYRHALRVGEVKELRWRMIDLKRKVIRVNRMMNGINSVQPLQRDELAALRKLKREYPGRSHLFISRLGNQISEKAVSRAIADAGRKARFRFRVTPSMLRRGCGHALADAGHSMVALQHYLGHRNIRHTLRYFELSDKPFKDFWKD